MQRSTAITACCAVLVAFNSILQIVLFAPYAVFYVQVVTHGDKTNVSYDKVAQSVGLFLGIPLGARPDTARASKTRRRGQEIYSVHRSVLADWAAVHNHSSVREPGCACGPADHLCPACMCPSSGVLSGHLPRHHLVLLEDGLWIQSKLYPRFCRRKQQL